MKKRVASLVEIITFVIFVVLAIRWAVTQNGWFEPYTVICGLVLGGLDLGRRYLGRADAHDSRKLNEQIKVSLKACGAATAPPPFSTGEPIHLQIDLIITNVGDMPVFIVSASLKDKRLQRSLGFCSVCSETEPLQPGGRRKGALSVLYHQPFSKHARSARTQEALYYENLFCYKLLRFICQEGSVFQVETGRGDILSFPAIDVCDASFLGWPFLATPDDILAEHGNKTLDDMLEEERKAMESVGARHADTVPPPA